ncbi:Os12g0432750 [Oryza sativa Japonica Group]|uniref:Os12g0432750 protein n=1 Tax=Oryza sativa subsp. japonica TaxID=39947 RepID=A0A0P0Y9P4_ORYSJ|nr:hypothetical protein DAI22_12g112600 [Oryza sativa Japonica Group]BAT16952.1 Os12g0432750 [Oryza sativa Japonica Group]
MPLSRQQHSSLLLLILMPRRHHCRWSLRRAIDCTLSTSPLCHRAGQSLAVYDEGVSRGRWATPEPPMVALLLSVVPPCRLLPNGMRCGRRL